ncbi:glycosyl hydrolase [Pedobacter ginsenosidimutans]|uniref:Glycosyl hydrolase n=1 Tax=Pedobacter ginsenosidimutans TaxID=687842 RepID=A0A0T5VWQ9_9SPHI|nr:glycosyl hydrolase [Pedobacter ginsenosidimutans]
MDTKSCLLFVFLSFFSSAVISQDKLKGYKFQEVSLLESAFEKAQLTDKNYMLSLDADRLLSPYIRESGLIPKATSYGNWENTGLDGHTCGHYVSALSFMYASTRDIRLKKKLDYVIDELERCQIKNGDGYLSGIPGGKEMWNQIRNGNIKASSSSLNGKWVPLYNIHKIYSGLYDAYEIAGNLKAKKMLISLTDWCINLVSKLTDQQIQTMLKSEYGGLNEVFANVYSLTSDEKYLKLALQFSDQSILKPLEDKKDALNGLHANTQIPKVIGFQQIASVSNNNELSRAAEFFWETVVEHRSVSIGGNSVREHFNPSKDFSLMLESREGPETCNSYNMLKLTKQLFLQEPSSKYIDYYERTLYNHILTSQRSEGGFVYFTPMRPGHYRTYSRNQESFWCCVGSGLENHGKYGELIYAHNSLGDIYVNLFIPSKLDWKEKGVALIQQNNFPQQDFTTIKLKLNNKKKFALNIRKPSWVTNGKISILVNGENIDVKDLGNGYVSVDRLWSTEDLVKVILPMHSSAEFIPDGSDWVSFLHGPVVLAAEMDTLSQSNLTADGSRMGHIASGQLLPINQVPLISGNKSELAAKLIPTSNTPLSFTADAIIAQQKYKKMKLVPFYSLSEKRYVIYFPYSTLENLPEKSKAVERAEMEKMKLEQETVDLVNTGEQQPESDHNFKGEKTENGIFRENHFRTGSGWFSYQLNNKDLSARKVQVLLYGAEKNRNFDVLINDVLIETVRLNGEKGDIYFTRDFLIPAQLLNKNIVVKFQTIDGTKIGNIFQVRLMK